MVTTPNTGARALASVWDTVVIDADIVGLQDVRICNGGWAASVWCTKIVWWQ
jgi:hypothetical protein